MTYYLTRAVLDRKAPEHALKSLLDPPDGDAVLNAHHRLMWTLFPDRCAKRDFLWRSDENGKFLILSARKPQVSRLFKPLESKPFAPLLAVGDQLGFILRVNATRDRRSGPQDDVSMGARSRPTKNRRVDIVMHGIQEQGLQGGTTGVDSRAARRLDVADEAARAWMNSQGEQRGFSIVELAVEDYRVRKLKRRRGADATFGVLDLKGMLTVFDPEVFTNALLGGFGRAKAYGCGLMLIRRA